MVVGDIFRNIFGGGVGYGDLWVDFIFDGGDFEIEIIFEYFLFEWFVDENDVL